MDPCQHDICKKSFLWIGQEFTDSFAVEYEYLVCAECGRSDYTGNCKFVSLKRVIDKRSVSDKIKNKYAKSERDISLKKFVKNLAELGDQDAIDWLSNKKETVNVK